jgi:signal transduction histidine kinase
LFGRYALDAWGSPAWWFSGIGDSSIVVIVAALVAIVLLSLGLLLNLVRKPVAGWIAHICAIVITIVVVAPLLSTMHWPGVMMGLILVLLVGFSLYVLRLMGRLAKLEQSVQDNANRTEEMQEMLGSQRRMAKSTEHVSRLEERNRLAARIHDEIGHGMSGSILLLEGADLIMDKEPEKARVTIRRVAENLRESVEKIRKVLRDERSASAEVSLARIENELKAFEADHAHIRTRLETQGDMTDINGAVWTCVYENLVEALTNMLKHSSATLFRVSLKNSAGLLHVEFSDNGGESRSGTRTKGGRTKGDDKTKGDGSSVQQDKQLQESESGELKKDGEIITRPGIGLQNMEERVAICYGRCFFRNEPDGFHIVMTFPRRDSV